MFRMFFCTSLLAAVGLAASPWGQAQQIDPEVREAYFRAVGEYFQTPLEEVSILGEWDLHPDEVPVALFLARQAGISPDVPVGLRRSGQAWRDVGRRFGVHTPAFHLPLPTEAEKGPLSAAYEAFHGRPSREWRDVVLEDAEIIALVNLRVLSTQTGVDPLQVLRHYQEAGSFVSCYPRLISGSGR